MWAHVQDPLLRASGRYYQLFTLHQASAAVPMDVLAVLRQEGNNNHQAKHPKDKTSTLTENLPIICLHMCIPISMNNRRLGERVPCIDAYPMHIVALVRSERTR